MLLLAFPPLQAAAIFQFMDRVFGTSFFLPSGLYVGGEVLKPTSWHFAHEQWGGNQMQSRFLKDSKSCIFK